MKNFIRRKDVINMLESESAVIQELIDYNAMIYANAVGKEKAQIGRELVSLHIRLRQTNEISRYMETFV